MISTEKKATTTTTQILSNKQRSPSTKKQLIARWSTVNGELVCRWVKV